MNIVVPSSFPAKTNFAVKIYIHGGFALFILYLAKTLIDKTGSFLQFGSPHSLGSQAQYIAVERSEVWVNIGYRLSAFGFLACDEPRVEGNFGFKDQWIALEWVRDNIDAFGGKTDGFMGAGLPNF